MKKLIVIGLFVLTGLLYFLNRGKKSDIQSQYLISDYYKVEALAGGFSSPMEIAISSDEKVFVIERQGAVKLYEPGSGVRTIHQLSVMYAEIAPKENYARECGALGLTLDPDFKKNGFLYIYYSAFEKSVNRLSRFSFNGNILTDEKVLLEVECDRASEIYHEGGSLAFGLGRQLFIGIGDNTIPNQSDGFTSIDERKERNLYDSQRTAGNSNDLRGSILRITVNEDGSYDIPKGNLYPPGTPKTRPEIYIKGCRNPFRISFDKKKSALYWGDVGPNGIENNPQRGPLGMDELNQATEAGFYGWPYFIGKNEPYVDYDFATKSSLTPFSGDVRNNSPNNTGLETFEDAQTALLSYGNAESDELPNFGSGARTIMAGPMYYQKTYENSLPSVLNHTLFFYDWSRSWIKVAIMNEDGNIREIHPFLNGEKFEHPIDMEIGPKGDMYLLEYGSQWYGNSDGVLKKISFSGYNRAPEAKISANKTTGSVPLTVSFTGDRSFDKDDKDKLVSYNWDFGDGARSSETNPTYTFEKAGVYEVKLSVTDQAGNTGSKMIKIICGNEAPLVKLRLKNKAEFLDWGQRIDYEVNVTDKEDPLIAPERLLVTAEYFPKGLPDKPVDTDPRLKGIDPYSAGSHSIIKNNCLACHQSELTIIGPAFKDIAEKYKDDPAAEKLLLKKIQNGGSGTWGNVPMPPHAHLEVRVIEDIITAILDMSKGNAKVIYGKSGSLTLGECPDKRFKAEGVYVLKASYTDNGANTLPAITGESKKIVLKAPPYAKRLKTDGETEITVEDADIIGTGAKKAGDIGYYEDLKTHVIWRFYVQKTGYYHLSLNTSNASKGGATYEVRIGEKSFPGTIEKTISWDKHQKNKLGKIYLPEGRHSALFVPLTKEELHIGNIQSFFLKAE